MTLYGASILRGLPSYSPRLTERLDQALIEVGGRDAFTVATRPDVDMPVALRHGPRPVCVAAIDFIEGLDDDALRGVAALQHGALADPGRERQLGILRAARVLLAGGAALAAETVTSTDARVFAVIASVGVAGLWAPGALLAALSNFSRYADAYYRRSDRNAAELVEPAVVADALRAMDAWRINRRATRPVIRRVAQRLATPILPDWHERERAERLTAHVPLEHSA